MAELFYLSDKSYNYLARHAIEKGYINPESIRQNGMSRFLEALSFRSFTDTRPQGISEFDDLMLESRRTPTWATGINQRRSRSISIDEETKVRYGVIALKVKILVDRWHKGGPVWNSPNSITSAVLEAIGIRYLTPDEWPEPVEFNRDELNELLRQTRA